MRGIRFQSNARQIELYLIVTLLHSERPKLYGVLVPLSVTGLNKSCQKTTESTLWELASQLQSKLTYLLYMWANRSTGIGPVDQMGVTDENNDVKTLLSNDYLVRSCNVFMSERVN